jgi:UDP-hydrolysing UDP-N-acetyl-D-glucosamine 2-epimerase
LAERRAIAVVTTGRQDYGILRSSLLLLEKDPRFDLQVWAGGMHLSPTHGHTVDRVRADGYRTVEPLAFEVGRPFNEFGGALQATHKAFDAHRPDAIVLLGDRTETLAIGTAAMLAGVPIVHLHGGEESEGAIDNVMRHALTKMSHLHLVSHEVHAKRVRQMGEPAETVVVVGAAGLDNLHRDDLPDRAALEKHLGIALPSPIVVVTQHATTLGGDSAAEASALATAMTAVPATYVVTQPNSDAGGAEIRAIWNTWWSDERKNAVVVDALGEKNFWGLLKIAFAMLGNSSSGILEAPAAGLPVVNVGDRQKGRLRSAHVVDVAPEATAIEAALRRAIDPETKRKLAGEAPLYPSGPAAPRIVEAIARWKIPVPPRKKFEDLP